jgi:cation transport protein ChaC
MSLTRADLESGRFHRLWSECATGPRPLSEAELEASIAHVLAGACPDADVWVFGYGSLIWNPLFHFEERRRATLRGFHRRFCLWSVMGRGSPERPGLVLGLDNGGACCGLAYRLPAGKALEELKLLWRREMVVGSYVPRWARVETAPGEPGGKCVEELRALAFVVNHQHPNYAGRLALDAVAQALAAARGHLGSSADYLFHTVDALAAHGLRDGHLERVRDRVRAHQAALAMPAMPARHES